MRGESKILDDLLSDLRRMGNPAKAKFLSGFLKTKKGEYGEGDVFWGVTVPDCRSIAGRYKDAGLNDIKKLLTSEVHEARLVALVMLVQRFERGDEVAKRETFDFYLDNIQRVNNWDLVDLSAPKIVGAYLFGKPLSILFDLAHSDNIWKRRISIISTLYFIKKGDFVATLKISKILLTDKEDLIHKAVGWMLREVGKVNGRILQTFLEKNAKKMPRTMLRYAIERLPEKKRRHFLTKG